MNIVSSSPFFFFAIYYTKYGNGNCLWFVSYYSLNTAGFPVHLLPKIVSPPAVAGPLIESWHGIPAGIPVGVAMGDLQCGVHSVQPDLRQAGKQGNK